VSRDKRAELAKAYGARTSKPSTAPAFDKPIDDEIPFCPQTE
jgi:hypothetical protein